MQFNVPQFIDIEDKIVGPLTLRQFLLLVLGGVIFIILWYIFKLWFVLIIGIPLGGLLLASVFLKINGRPFHLYLLSWASYLASPKVYLWRKK